MNNKNARHQPLSLMCPTGKMKTAGDLSITKKLIVIAALRITGSLQMA
jgi:hypothetical protein